MRLINTTTGEFETFWDTQRPQYGILSHTWGDEEVSYLDYLFLKSSLPATSAGLVHALLKGPRTDSEGIRKREVFCNKFWEVIASKAEIGAELSAISRIPLIFLNDTVSPSDNKLCSIAMRMSWVSHRQTTRVEDMAYCMLGLFDVHMPLIYGEGRKAFMRLQLEILKKSDDDSIYAWKAPLVESGLLATWPTAFAESDNIVQLVFPEDPTPWIPPVMTSIGLEMRGRYERHDPHQDAIDAQHKVHTIHTSINTDDEMWLVMYCGPKRESELPITRESKHKDEEETLMLRLQRNGPTWQRVNCNTLDFTDYTMYKPRKMEAYTIFYVEQQGL
ncbi:hypothetical protein DV736_g458, partial [Chaetothyriales sp. CBS 134916]